MCTHIWYRYLYDVNKISGENIGLRVDVIDPDVDRSIWDVSDSSQVHIPETCIPLSYKFHNTFTLFHTLSLVSCTVSLKK